MTFSYWPPGKRVLCVCVSVTKIRNWLFAWPHVLSTGGSFDEYDECTAFIDFQGCFGIRILLVICSICYTVWAIKAKDEVKRPELKVGAQRDRRLLVTYKENGRFSCKYLQSAVQRPLQWLNFENGEWVQSGEGGVGCSGEIFDLGARSTHGEIRKYEIWHNESHCKITKNFDIETLFKKRLENWQNFVQFLMFRLSQCYCP